MEAFEDLVVGVAGYFQIRINKAQVNAGIDGVQLHLRLHILKDVFEALELFGVLGEEVVGKILLAVLFEILDQQGEVLIKDGLGLNTKCDWLTFQLRLPSYFYTTEVCEMRGYILRRFKGLSRFSSEKTVLVI